MRYVRVLVALLGLSLCLCVVSCGGGSPITDPPTSPPPPPPPPAVTVDIAPGAASVTITQTQQFTATVGNSSNTTVAWAVNGVVGGNATAGTISATGLYTAPAKLPSPAQVTVSAASAADTTKTASGTITVVPYAGVFTYHNDNARTGQDLNETLLTLENVNQTKFGKIFSAAIDGQTYAQPLYLAHASIGGNFHNVAYVATEHDTVYAFDADGLSPAPLWQKSLIPADATTIPSADLSTPITNEIGITSTPVIDGATGTMYVVAATKESGTYVARLHALDVLTGAEKFGGPVTIQATSPGTGIGSVGGQIAFQTLLQLQRTAILLLKDTVYLAWGSQNDLGPYHGWVLAYDAETLDQLGVWNDTPNGSEGGIWLSGSGLSADEDGNIYVVTGNGTFDADTGGSDYGDSVVKVKFANGTFATNDFFTPFDQMAMALGDIDLGASGLVLFNDAAGPVPDIGVIAGKNGKIYVLNLDNLGQFHAGSDIQIPQSIAGALGTTPDDQNYTTAVTWQDNFYFAGNSDVMKQYKLTNGQLTLYAQTPHVFGYTTASSVSSNGANDGIVWTMESGGDMLHAFDATNIAHELYNTKQAPGGRDGFGRVVRWTPPTVVNGKVYVAGATQFAIFGLLP